MLDFKSSGFLTRTSAGVVNEVIYFLVTNVEHSVVTNLVPITEQDLYIGSTIGELGCWIDSSVTRMIQTGLEHARVPEVGSYFESGTLCVHLSKPLPNKQFKICNGTGQSFHSSRGSLSPTCSTGMARFRVYWC